MHDVPLRGILEKIWMSCPTSGHIFKLKMTSKVPKVAFWHNITKIRGTVV